MKPDAPPLVVAASTFTFAALLGYFATRFTLAIWEYLTGRKS